MRNHFKTKRKQLLESVQSLVRRPLLLSVWKQNTIINQRGLQTFRWYNILLQVLRTVQQSRVDFVSFFAMTSKPISLTGTPVMKISKTAWSLCLVPCEPSLTCYCVCAHHTFCKTTLFFLTKNLVFKNIEAQKWKKIRPIIRTSSASEHYEDIFHFSALS